MAKGGSYLGLACAVAFSAASSRAVTPIVIEPVVPPEPPAEKPPRVQPEPPPPRERYLLIPLWNKLKHRAVRSPSAAPAPSAGKARLRPEPDEAQRRALEAEEEIRHLQTTIRDLHALQTQYEEELRDLREQLSARGRTEEPKAAPEPWPAEPDTAAETARLQAQLAEANEKAAALEIAVERLRQENATQRVLLLQRDSEIEDLRKSLDERRPASASPDAPPGAAAERIAELERLLLQADRRALQLEKALREQRGDTLPELEVEPPAASRAEPLEESLRLPAADQAETGTETASAPAPLPLSAREQTELANNLLHEGRLAEAERLFETALEADEGLLGARFGLAACRYAQHDFPEASRLLEQVLQQDPSYARALGLRGIIACQNGDLKTALEDLERAVRTAPNDAHLHNYLGIVHHARKAYSASVRSFRRAVELDPGHAEARFNLAVVLATSDRPLLDEARASYEAALRLGNPRDRELEQILYP